MKRRILAATLVLLFPLGMAACGSQSKAAACHEIDNAAASSSTQAQKNGQTTSRDPKVLRDRMADLTSTCKKASKKVTNKKVKPAFNNLIADLEKFRDLADKDSSDVSTEDFQVLQDISTHGQELNDICGFKWDSGK